MGRHSLPDPDDAPDEPRTGSAGRARDLTSSRPSDVGFGAGHDRDFGSGRRTASRLGATSTTDQPARRSAAAPARQAGAQHSGDWDGGEWTGSHRAVTPKRRGVSIGVIVALVSVVVVVGVVILWRFFGDALSDRSDVAAARCVDGEVTVAVVADPAITESVATLARALQRDRRPGRRPLRQGRCQVRRFRSGGRRIHRRVARRPRRATGAVDPRQLGVGGAAGGRRRERRRSATAAPW